MHAAAPTAVVPSPARPTTAGSRHRREPRKAHVQLANFSVFAVKLWDQHTQLNLPTAPPFTRAFALCFVPVVSYLSILASPPLGFVSPEPTHHTMPLFSSIRRPSPRSTTAPHSRSLSTA